MIMLTRLNGEKFMVNQDLIEFIDKTPDTVISMTSGKKIPVVESLQAVRNKVIRFKQKVNSRQNTLKSYELKTKSADEKQQAKRGDGL